MRALCPAGLDAPRVWTSVKAEARDEMVRSAVRADARTRGSGAMSNARTSRHPHRNGRDVSCSALQLSARLPSPSKREASIREAGSSAGSRRIVAVRTPCFGMRVMW